jgi:hypothetical protein
MPTTDEIEKQFREGRNLNVGRSGAPQLPPVRDASRAEMYLRQIRNMILGVIIALIAVNLIAVLVVFK